MSKISAAAADVAPMAIELRRALHRNPELGFAEFDSTRRIAEALSEAGIGVTVRPSGTGLVADVGTDGPLVAFRADLDALPIAEQTGLPFASQVEGVMHACGHDAHSGIGVGIALAAQRLDLPGRVRFIFQPGEEVFPGGARDLVAEGVLDDVQAITAFHVDPALEVGRIGLKPGPITSSSDRFKIRLEGPGGHTARPHETVDLLYAAGRVLTDLPTVVHRSIDTRIPVALVFGRVASGDADNVIPTVATLSGTCRLLDRATWQRMPDLIDRLVHEIVAPTGAKATVEYVRGIPPVVNDPHVVSDLEYAIADELGRMAAADTDASMGAEDFAEYLVKVPGALMRLGVAGDGPRVPLHSSRFDLDERGIEVGIAAATAGLLRLLEGAR